MNPRAGVAAGLAGAAVALSACGAHTITKNDVIARANQICETASSSARSVPAPVNQSLPELARYYERVTPVVETEVVQLRALPRPEQDRALLNRYLQAIATSATEYKGLTVAARAGDQGAFASASARLRADPAASLATRYGITRCGQSSGTAAS